MKSFAHSASAQPIFLKSTQGKPLEIEEAYAIYGIRRGSPPVWYKGCS
jgi:hypothetical protein